MTAVIQLLLSSGMFLGGIGLLVLGVHEARGGTAGWTHRREQRRADNARELRQIGGHP